MIDTELLNLNSQTRGIVGANPCVRPRVGNTLAGRGKGNPPGRHMGLRLQVNAYSLLLIPYSLLFRLRSNRREVSRTELPVSCCLVLLFEPVPGLISEGVEGGNKSS